MEGFDRPWWDSVVRKEDGSLNEEAVFNELSDYQFLLEQASEVYCAITDGTLSKTNYYASSVLSAHETVLEQYISEAVHEALQRIRDGEDIDKVWEDYKAHG